MLASASPAETGPVGALLGKGQFGGAIPAAAPAGRSSVLVVDDHALVRESLTIALQCYGLSAASCAVVDTESVLDQAAAIEPGVVLLHLELGRDGRDRTIDSTEMLGALRANGWAVVAVTGRFEADRVAAAVAAGAAAILSKSTPLHELLRVVADVTAGNSVISYEERRRWLNLHRQLQADARRRSDRLSRLTPREREVLGLLAAGRRAAAIAEALVVSLPTVRSQIRSILAKLEVRSQLEAVALVWEDRATVLPT